MSSDFIALKAAAVKATPPHALQYHARAQKYFRAGNIFSRRGNFRAANSAKPFANLMPTTPAETCELRELYDRVMAPTYAPLPIVPERGEGARLWDAAGKMYFDFAGGIAVSALGHAHPQLQRALQTQAGKLMHVSNLLVNAPAIELARRLCELTFAERVFFANSGSEVNEAALKLARRHAYLRAGENKHGIVAFDNAFHGRTFFAVCVGGQKKYSDNFGPKPGGITHLPFNDIAALEAGVDASTCAVILELIQGEAGVLPATLEFVRAARKVCDKHDALLIFDEVQTGVGRSGELYMYQKLGVVPDILTTAKGLGGGLPIGAMLSRAEVANSFEVGAHGSTFGGNPVACAAANCVLDIVSAPATLAAIRKNGKILRRGLEDIGSRFEIFREIRGEGLLLGCELTQSWHGRARELVAAAMRHGVLALVAGPNVLRLAPPLIISEKEIAQGLKLLAAAIEEVAEADDAN